MTANPDALRRAADEMEEMAKRNAELVASVRRVSDQRNEYVFKMQIVRDLLGPAGFPVDDDAWPTDQLRALIADRADLARRLEASQARVAELERYERIVNVELRRESAALEGFTRSDGLIWDSDYATLERDRQGWQWWLHGDTETKGHHTPAFVAMDWRTVAEWMGATLVRADPERGEVTVFRGGAFVDGAWRPDEVLIISDNGGEVNVSAVVPRLDFSLPYEQTHRVVGPATLGVWLQQALNGAADKIDYFDDLDAPVTP